MNIAVIAHAAAKPTVDLFKPHWQRLNATLNIYHPEGEAAGSDYQIGISAYRGQNCVRRFIKTAQHALDHSSEEWLCVMEYDTVNLTAEWPKLYPDRMNAGLFDLYDTGNLTPGNHCALSPWIAQRPIWSRVLEALKADLAKPLPEWTLGGLLDRCIGHALKTHAIPRANILQLLAYPWRDDAHKQIAARGITWVHGWKTKEDFGPLFPTL